MGRSTVDTRCLGTPCPCHKARTDDHGHLPLSPAEAAREAGNPPVGDFLDQAPPAKPGSRVITDEQMRRAFAPPPKSKGLSIKGWPQIIALILIPWLVGVIFIAQAVIRAL